MIHNNYYAKRKKHDFLKKIRILYLFVVILRLFILAFLFQIIQLRDTDTSVLSQYNKAKIVFLSSPYMISFFPYIRIVRSQAPQIGDIVLIESSEYKNKPILLKFTSFLIETITLGILKQNKYNIATIKGTANQTLHYSAKRIFENPKNIETYATNIPFFDTVNTLTLSDDEVFVSISQNYAVDSRVFGALDISDIKGKALFALGPYWEWVEK